MAAVVRFDIDLQFSRVDSSSPEVLEGTITASGSEVIVTANHPELLASARTMTIAQLRELAETIARLGITVTLAGPGGALASIGAVKSNILQRGIAGSPNIRLGSPALLAPLVLPKARAGIVTLPPPTPFPLFPTYGRRRRRRVSTTHYTPGSGRPRLIFTVGSENWDGTPPREFNLLPGTTLIGAGEDADLRLEGLGAVSARIRHTAQDEYVYQADGVPDVILRTGARISLGTWRMAYFREEFADHGRPFGGRLGGELSRQRPQPQRPL